MEKIEILTEAEKTLSKINDALDNASILQAYQGELMMAIRDFKKGHIDECELEDLIDCAKKYIR